MKERFLEAAKLYSNHIRDSVEATLDEMESRWYDVAHTVTEAEKMVDDYNKGLLPVQTKAIPSVDMWQADMTLKMYGGMQ